MPDTRNKAQRNRAVRQEALRQQLAAQGHVQHVVTILEKLSDVDTDIPPEMIQRYKIVIDTKLALIKKYCPDLKMIEKVEGSSLDSLTDDELDAAITELRQATEG